ncbi:MAG: signal peptide peptidase SppA [Bacillota bacterium]|nr:signal peptide peptidase SppA [Bacillota bacterium]
MNKKRWLAVALALVIMAISLAVPSFKESEVASSESFSSFYEDFFAETFTKELKEKTVQEGDPNSRILLLDLDGAIMAGGGYGFTPGYNHDFFLEQLDKVLEDPSIAGILFTINSPGGGVYESAEIRDKLLKIKDAGIPIYVSMKNLAASGGYYVAADADKIFASPETWTGSIGVITQTMDYSGLMEKYGVKSHIYASGRNKAMGSSVKAPSEEEVEIWMGLINESYDQFVNIVANGRNMDETKVRQIADGRIYSGKQAVENGLVDDLANSEEALAALIEDYNLEEASIFYYSLPTDPFSDFFGPFYSFMGQKSELSDLKYFIEKQESSLPRAYYLYGGF